MAQKKRPDPSTPVEQMESLPINTDAERLILGSIMLNDNSFSPVSETLKYDDFGLEKHRRIFSRMKDLHDRGVKIDRVSLADELMKAGQLESVDGLTYLNSLDEGLPEIPNLDGYIRIVLERSMERRTITAAAKIVKGLMTNVLDGREALHQASRAFTDLQERIESNSRTIYSGMDIVEADSDGHILRPWNHTPGMPTGFPRMDTKLNGGLISGRVYCISADTSSGKTSLAINITMNLIDHGHPVLYFSSEMPKEDMLHRLASCKSRISYSRFCRGWLQPDDLRAFHHGIEEVVDMPIYMDDSTPLSIHEFDTRSRRMVRDKGIKCIVLDYIQLMNLRSSGDGIAFRDERDALTHISACISRTAKNLGVPIIFLSQFSRSKRIRDKSDRRPKLSDLFGTSALENNSNVVIAIYREEFDKPNAEELRNTAELMILKNRQGERGTIHCRFDAPCMKFEESGE